MSQPVIVFHHKGDLRKTDTFLKMVRKRDSIHILGKYGRMGVDRLNEATPRDTGETAVSWYYTIERNGHDYRLIWKNSNLSEGIPIVVLLQYGHGTRGGTYVEGRDFINPALRPVFDALAEELWREVRRL